MTNASDALSWLGRDESLHFGRFEIMEVVGCGGMATVVRARAPRGVGLPPIVALKFLHRELTFDPKTTEAFLQEALMGMRCVHPGLCRTYALEMVRGRSALVMEFLSGNPLIDFYRYLRASARDAESRVAAAIIGSQIAHALHALHEARDEAGELLGAVHRDVTPHNVIVTPEGESKLFDYGVAFSSKKSTRTARGIVKGKISYLPPEYLAGKSWDRRFDIWSLGVILWELLTGMRLFRANTPAERLNLVTSLSIMPPSHLRPTIEPTLDRIVLRALERDPARRYSSALEMAKSFDAFLDEMEIDRPKRHLAHWVRSQTCERSSGVLPCLNVVEGTRFG